MIYNQMNNQRNAANNRHKDNNSHSPFNCLCRRELFRFICIDPATIYNLQHSLFSLPGQHIISPIIQDYIFGKFRRYFFRFCLSVCAKMAENSNNFGIPRQWQEENPPPEKIRTNLRVVILECTFYCPFHYQARCQYERRGDEDNHYGREYGREQSKKQQ